jgi:hypothetical protein
LRKSIPHKARTEYFEDDSGNWNQDKVVRAVLDLITQQREEAVREFAEKYKETLHDVGVPYEVLVPILDVVWLEMDLPMPDFVGLSSIISPTKEQE